MVDKSKKGKKGSISEDDMSALLRRYSMDAVLGLLQMVEQSAGAKIDWHEVAKNSKEISGARECQVLWRHLAYGETLIDQLDNDPEPIDDNSDLEHEVEPSPAIGREASVEAAACVKVLIAGYPKINQLPSNSSIEAPLTINKPNTKAVCASSDGSHPPYIPRVTNVCIPVSVQKIPLASGGVTGEKRPNNEIAEVNYPSRRRRRSWSLEEDSKLTASVQKHGERNWANIARWDFNNDRRASELSQRWSTLRKKQGNPKAGTSSQPPETQLAAAHRAMSLALNMPMGDNKKSAAAHMAAAGIKTQHQPPKTATPPADQKLQRIGPTKPQMLANRPSVNPISDRDSMVKAAAVAAGARIATPADASSLIEAAKSQNVVHITTSIAHQLPSNVHFIRNGLAKAPISTYSAPKPSVPETTEAKAAAQSRFAKATASAVATNPTGSVQVSNTIKESAAAPTPSTKLPETKDEVVVTTSDNEKKEVGKSNEGTDVAEVSGCAPMEEDPENQSAASGNQLEEAGNNQPCTSGNAVKENIEGDEASVLASEPISQATDDGVTLPSSSQVEDGKS